MRNLGILAGVALSCCTWVAASHAAETVLADGAAHSCYEAAQFNANARDGVAACTAALDANSLTLADRAATLINRGILKSRLPNYRSALVDYDQGLALRPDLAEAYVDRGAVLIMLKRYDDAIADLSKGIALGSRELQVAYYDRGLVRERTGDLTGACADYRQAVALQPDFTQASGQLGICPKVEKAKPS